mmetsp:Transcript_14690/g.40045  ORF Transcript_14690/g.40045 Transcript_14690/m.40045 type:complete len:252 (-) Transcript_14690:60-815(-)
MGPTYSVDTASQGRPLPQGGGGGPGVGGIPHRCPEGWLTAARGLPRLYARRAGTAAVGGRRPTGVPAVSSGVRGRAGRAPGRAAPGPGPGLRTAHRHGLGTDAPVPPHAPPFAGGVGRVSQAGGPAPGKWLDTAIPGGSCGGHCLCPQSGRHVAVLRGLSGPQRPNSALGGTDAARGAAGGRDPGGTVLHEAGPGQRIPPVPHPRGGLLQDILPGAGGTVRVPGRGLRTPRHGRAPHAVHALGARPADAPF